MKSKQCKKKWRIQLEISIKECHRKSGCTPLFLICLCVFILSAIILLGYGVCCLQQNMTTRSTRRKLQDMCQETEKAIEYDPWMDERGISIVELTPICMNPEEEQDMDRIPKILPKYQKLYEINSDLIGWLVIDDTVIDYPVMQTPEEEDYYLQLNFYRKPDKNGCLILDTDSVAGTGTKVWSYTNGTAPSTNLIIHGHTMKSGEMFGNLKCYIEEEYGKEHSRICFDTLYEEREYELIAVFYSQVYYETDLVFKYYKFFQADTQEQFDDWYENIKALSLYDTGVTAQFGDEFITLSCCSYHVEDGRLVVIGKRVV